MQHTDNDNIRGLRAMELSCMLPDIEISASGVSLVTIQIDNETVFEEPLTPDGSGSIVLRELSDLVEPWAYARQTVSLSITASGGASFSASSTVVYCSADIGDESASTYLSSHWLSILSGPKLTAPGRLELLPMQGSGSASCTATYSDGSTASFSVSVYLSATSGRSFTVFDVSPGHYVASGKELVGYVVSSGSRSQAYEIDFSEQDAAPILIFENSFGVEEVVYCTGLHQVDPSYKRSSARIGRNLRNYRIEETRAFKADTGPLTTSMATWLDDLFRSKYVRVANVYNGVVTPGKEVVITDSKSSHSNDDAEIPRFTFTYQYAQRNHNVLQLERAGRIFDNTFDNTFN